MEKSVYAPKKEKETWEEKKKGEESEKLLALV